MLDFIISDFILGILASMTAAGIIAFFGFLILRTKWSKSYRRADSFIRRGQALQEAQQFNEAREEIEKSVRILEEEHKLKLLSKAYLLLGDIECKTERWENAIRDYILCRETTERVKNSISPDVILLRLGDAYRGAGRLDDAFRCIDKARELHEAIDNQPMLATSYTKLGEIEASRSHVEVAIEHFLRALNYQEKIRDRRSQGATRAFLGDLYIEKENQNEAMNHYRASAGLYREVGDLAIVNLLDRKISEVGYGNEN